MELIPAETHERTHAHSVGYLLSRHTVEGGRKLVVPERTHARRGQSMWGKSITQPQRDASARNQGPRIEPTAPTAAPPRLPLVNIRSDGVPVESVSEFTNALNVPLSGCVIICAAASYVNTLTLVFFLISKPKLATSQYETFFNRKLNCCKISPAG